MSEGFLADLDLENVEEDPNAFPDGTYNAYVFDAKVVSLTDVSKGKRLVLTYKLAPSEGKHAGKVIDEWKPVNKFDSDRDKAFLKQRLKSLGVPESKFASLALDELKGLEVRITKKQNGQYKNVNNVVLGHATEGGSGSTDSAAATAELL